MAKVVIIDDESSILELMSKLCRSVGHQVVPCLTGAEGLDAVRSHHPELVIVDLRIGDVSGLDIVKTCRQESPNSAVIMVTGHGSVETAVEAMRLGTFDYLTKPFDLDDLIKTVSHALARRSQAGTPTSAAQTALCFSSASKLIGHSDAIQKIFQLVRRVADSESPVLVEGEFGVGKHRVARAVHEASRRNAAPFKELQCSALPEDVLESELFGAGGASIFQRAGGGTVHLAEIHQLPARIQAKLNTFLDEVQNKRGSGVANGGTAPSFRLITSTTISLDDAASSGKFREDLYYKISVIPVKIPSLRQRREDIRPLVDHFLQNLAERSDQPAKAIDAHALEFLEKYSWPGNISELRNAVERACALCEGERIRPSDLPSKVSQQIEVPSPASGGKVLLPIGSPLDDFIRAQERLFVQETLKYNNGSREKTASMLSISIATLYRKIGLNIERKTTT